MRRPPKPSDAVRPNRLVTYISDAELERLESIADEKGTSLSGVAHAILARNLKRRAK